MAGRAHSGRIAFAKVMAPVDMKRLILALTLFVIGLALASPAQASTSNGGGQFIAVCGYSHSLPDDPIVHPGLPGASHIHDFGGSTTTNAFSTLASLHAGGTNCTVKAPNASADRSAYWLPELYFNGAPTHFNQMKVYYTTGTDVQGTGVGTPPIGLEVVAGNHHATGPQSIDVVRFECYNTPHHEMTAGPDTAPPVCPSGSLFKIVVLFPDCLASGFVVNGVDDTSQTTYAVNGKCPTGYSAIVQTRVEIKYPAGIDGRGTVQFSADPGSTTLSPSYTEHADWFNAWGGKTFNKFVQRCVNAGVNCGTTLPHG